MPNMPSGVVAGEIGEVRRAHTNAGGDDLATGTVYVYALPRHTVHLAITGVADTADDNTVATLSFAINPWLKVLRVDRRYDQITDLSVEAQDPDRTAGVVLAGGDELLIGAHRPFRGVAVDMSANVNDTAATLSVDYWSGHGWTALSVTDGTDSSGDTLKQSGQVTWTMPALGAWKRENVPEIAGLTDGSTMTEKGYPTDRYYWTRWTTSAALDAGTAADSMLAMAPSTDYAELLNRQTFEQMVTHTDVGNVGSVELTTNQASMIAFINVAVNAGGRFVHS